MASLRLFVVGLFVRVLDEVWHNKVNGVSALLYQFVINSIYETEIHETIVLIFNFATKILSSALISTKAQLQAQKLITSQIRLHIEYLT